MNEARNDVRVLKSTMKKWLNMVQHIIRKDERTNYHAARKCLLGSLRCN
jgi:hypothetical protein